MRRALCTKYREPIDQFIESLFSEGNGWRPNQTQTRNVGQSRRWPHGDKNLVPRPGADGWTHRLPGRESFYKDLERELAKSERRQARADRVVRRDKAGG